MLESLRPLLTKMLNPVARNMNINPNVVTVISPFVALIAAYGFANKMLLLGVVAILLSGFLDVVDGAVARYHGRASKFGAFLDSTMDRFADAIIYIGIIFGGYCDWFWGVLAIHSAISNYMKRFSCMSSIFKSNFIYFTIFIYHYFNPFR